MDTLNNIVRLLKEAKALGGDALEFSGLMMREFRTEMTGLACWGTAANPAHHLKGRSAEVIRAEKEAMLERSREEIRRKLTKLLEWARQKESPV